MSLRAVGRLVRRMRRGSGGRPCCRPRLTARQYRDLGRTKETFEPVVKEAHGKSCQSRRRHRVGRAPLDPGTRGAEVAAEGGELLLRLLVLGLGVQESDGITFSSKRSPRRHPKLPKAIKPRLRETYRTLDPVALRYYLPHPVSGRPRPDEADRPAAHGGPLCRDVDVERGRPPTCEDAHAVHGNRGAILRPRTTKPEPGHKIFPMGHARRTTRLIE